MAITSKIPLMFAVVGATLLSFSSSTAIAQVKVDKPKITISTPKTPRFDVSNTDTKRDEQKTWIEVEVEFKADQKGGDSDFIEQLEFRYYITVKPKDEKDRAVYTLTVNHINIPKGETMFSVAYISPTAIAKIIGKDANPSKSNVDVAVEIRAGGSTVAGEATKSPSSKWWTKMTQKDGVVLNKTQTPFAPLWWDRYVEVQGK